MLPRPPTKPLIILGTGGNCLEIVDLVADINAVAPEPVYECIGFLDDDPRVQGREFRGLPILGPLASATGFPRASFVNAIGSPSNFWRKDSIIAKTGLPLERFVSLIHPSASVSRTSSIGQGTLVFPHVTIGHNVRIGNHIIILPNSVISHDSLIGDYTCIASSVCICGRVIIGFSSYIGANSSIHNNVSVGSCCLVGMGAVVLRDCQSDSVVVGNPAKFLRTTRQDLVGVGAPNEGAR